MPSYRVAIVGGGIAGLCLAASLIRLNRQSASSRSDSSPIHIDIYEAAEELVEVGAGITLWGRVCEALRLMGMDEDCLCASVVAASATGESSNGFVLRGFRDKADYGRLPFQDAWSLHRADLLNILGRRIPSTSIHFKKRFVGYRVSSNSPITLTFSDNTTATCDVLVGADGIHSVVRAQLMRDTASSVRHDLRPHINPRFTGTLAYRALLPLEALRARNPEHSLLKGGVIYFGKSQHIVGYPISSETLNLAVNITNLAQANTEWSPSPSQSASGNEYRSSAPSSSSFAAQSQHHSRSQHSPPYTRESAVGSRRLDRASFQREIAPRFSGWGKEVEEVIQCIDTCIEWPVMDLDPLPFYTRGRIVLLGDAAHAAVPYVGAGAAFAIEDAYILSHLLHAAFTNTTQPQHSPLPRYPRTGYPIDSALSAYEYIRLPRGNALIENARLALRSFQFDGPCGDDMRGAVEVVCKIFEGAAGVGMPIGVGVGGSSKAVEKGSRGPKEDVEWGIARVRGLV